MAQVADKHLHKSPQVQLVGLRVKQGECLHKQIKVTVTVALAATYPYYLRNMLGIGMSRSGSQ